MAGSSRFEIDGVLNTSGIAKGAKDGAKALADLEKAVGEVGDESAKAGGPVDSFAAKLLMILSISSVEGSDFTVAPDAQSEVSIRKEAAIRPDLSTDTRASILCLLPLQTTIRTKRFRNQPFRSKKRRAIRTRCMLFVPS